MTNTSKNILSNIKINPDIFFCLLLLIVGLFLRLYRISQESVSLEEYACIANLNLNSIFHFLSEQRNTYPYGGILFPLLQYFWGKCFGTEIVSLRLFSVCIWIGFYLMFWFVLNKLERQGKLPDGTKFIVSIGITLSPALIFIGQEARMYMAYLFLIWGSFFLFMKVIEDISNNRTIVFWIIVNQMLLWTHHIGIVIWATEFLLLIAVQYKKKNHIKKVLSIVVIYSFFLIPWFAWILTIPPQPAQLHRYYLKPSLQELLSFPFALNIVGKGGICPIGISHPWQCSSSIFGAFLHHSQKGFELALILFSVLSLLGLLYENIQSWIYKKDTLRVPFFLLSLFVIPLLLLFLLARFGPPVFVTRYIVFLIPLHFLGLTYFLSHTRKFVSRILIILLIIVLLYPIGIMSQSTWRMDWKGVGKIISKNQGTQDIVIIHDPFWMPIFKLNNKDISIPATDAYTEEGLADIAQVYFDSLGPNQDKKTKAWIVIPDIYGTALNTFPSVLNQYGFSYFVHALPGEQKIYLFQISPSRERIYKNIFTINVDTKKLTKKFFKEASLLTDTFYRQHRYDHDRTGSHFIRCALQLAKLKKYKQAAYLLYYAWEQNPNLIVQIYEKFSEKIDFEQECRLLNYGTVKKNISAIFWNGVKCFSEHDYEGALSYFSKLTEECSEEPLFWWFRAQTCDNLSDYKSADWIWFLLFHLQPVLPIGWHFIYLPSAIICDKNAVEKAFHRAEELQILTEHLNKDIDYSLLK